MKRINKFTDRFVKSIKPLEQLAEYTEGNGFILRVSKTGVKSWVYSYSFNRKSKRLKLGRYPGVGVAEARKLHSDAVLLRDKGYCPIQVKQDKAEALARQQVKNQQTVKWLADDFYTRYIEKNRKVPEQIKQQIDADIIPSLGNINLEDITTRQITLALEKIVDRGANVHANKVLSTIKQMFTYALSKGIIERNPAQGINSINIGGKEKPRDRYLSMEEIKIIWQWLDIKKNHCLHPSTVLALKVLLLTGIRSGELRLAEWSEIDFDNSLWTIPAEKYKTGIKHKVHLTEFTIQHLQELKELSGCKWVLPSIKDDKNPQPLTDKALPRAVKRIEGRIIDINGNVLITKSWTPHDLRRTFNTQLSAIGITPHIVEKCLGHKLPGIMSTYNKHEYLPERKEALDQWSDKIEMLVTNSNVVMLNTQTK